VWFEKKSALAATGISAALVMAPEFAVGGNQRSNLVPIRSVWNVTALATNSVTSGEVFGGDSGPAVVSAPSQEQQWTEAEQKRFQELAVEEAVGSLSTNEAHELEQLTILRRAFDKPRSGDEVLWEFEQRRRTSELLKTLRRYVEFYEGADPAWTAASKSSH